MAQIGDLTLIKELNNGAYGKVYLSKKSNPNIYCATKIIDRPKTDQNEKLKEFFETEIYIMKNFDHPNIIKLIDLKKDNNYYYVVMEYANGGDLNHCLKEYIKKYHRPFPEEIVQYLMRQIFEAIAFIHSYNVIHRDLKLKNIMVNFDSEKDKKDLNMMRAKIKIIDFGVSKIAVEASTVIGSPPYMDPIILEEYIKGKKDKYQRKLENYSQEVDIWSLGCICYELFMGEVPFNGYTKEEVLDQIKNGKYLLRKNVSPELKDFLSRMLRLDGKYRLTAKELLNQNFLVKNAKDFAKSSMYPPKNYPVDVSKYDNYTFQKGSDNEIQYTNQFGNISYETQVQNKSKDIATYDNTNTNKNTDNNVQKSYYNIPMTSTNSESNMQTANFQSGQHPYQSNFGSNIQTVQNQTNINNDIFHF